MFARVIKGKQKEYVSIVRGYRAENGKVKQKTVFSLGAVTEKTKEATLAIANNIIAATKGQEIIQDADSFTEIARKNWGAPAVVDNIWSKFNFDEVIISPKFSTAIKLMLANRLVAPSSKLQCYHTRSNYCGFEEVKLHELYRSLDYLHDNHHIIKQHIFDKQKIFGSCDIVFFDVTTLYFESQKANNLKNFGYSKDCKFNEVQIVLSLVVNKEGRPLSYEIFAGNSFEGHTLMPCLQKIQQQLEINRIIIVADRGIGSKANLDALKQAGFDYIIGAKLGSASQKVKQEALNKDDHTMLVDTEGSKMSYKFIKNNQEDWICLWSEKRAQKDAKDRERLIKRAEEMIDSNNLKDKRGAKKYISIKGNNEAVGLDLEKIADDAQFDGFYSIAFSDPNLSPQDIVSAYHNLWRIEESFRAMKYFFEARPMFHWSEERISGHILMTFMALVIERDLELKLAQEGLDISCFKIREHLAKMQYSEMQIGNSLAQSVAPLDEEQMKFLKICAIKPKRNSLHKKPLL